MTKPTPNFRKMVTEMSRGNLLIPIIRAALYSPDFQGFTLRATARTWTPRVRVAFDSNFGPLTYATDRYDWWQDNIRAIARVVSVPYSTMESATSGTRLVQQFAVFGWV